MYVCTTKPKRIMLIGALCILTAWIPDVSACAQAAIELAEGQERQLVGTVVDPSGAALVGATVQIRRVNDTFRKAMQTDRNGSFSLSGISVGRYILTVSSPGFQASEISVTIMSGESRTPLRIVLAVSAVSTTVSVQGREDDLVGIADSGTQGTVGAQETVYVDAYYKMADGSTAPAPRATQAFTVNGPTGSLLPNGYVQTNDTATVLGNSTGNPASLKMSNAPTDPNVNWNPNVGVRFDDLATLPRGSLMWVQILNTVNYLQIAPTNSGYTPTSSNAAAQLDGVYPYVSASNNTTNDAPSRSDLLAGLGEGAISFDATMYALWDSAIPPAGQTSCTPATTNVTYKSTASTCSSIPVPLGSIEWKWTPCAINTIPPPPAATGPSWVRKCGPGSISSGIASGYPTWTSCHKSANGGC